MLSKLIDICQASKALINPYVQGKQMRKGNSEKDNNYWCLSQQRP